MKNKKGSMVFWLDLLFIILGIVILVLALFQNEKTGLALKDFLLSILKK